MYTKKQKIYPAYVSRHNTNQGKQVILLIIPNGERWHYVAVKQLFPLSRGRTSKHYHNTYKLNKYKFSNHDINKFILLLRKDIYPYEYMMIGKNSTKHHYLKKEDFYSQY